MVLVLNLRFTDKFQIKIVCLRSKPNIRKLFIVRFNLSYYDYI